MKKEKMQTLEEANGEAIREDFKVYEEQMKAQEESEAAAENIDSVPEPDDSTVSVVDGATEIVPTEEELNQMNNPADVDPDYLEYSAEAVGYQDRKNQWEMYRLITTYLQADEDGELEILDFGCGRGDFDRFYNTEFPGQELDYVGVDMNQQIIEAGKNAYNDEVDLRCMDWFNLPKDLKQDWVINVNSNNLRYDADTTKTDVEYLQNTIHAMYRHANKGIVLMLSTGLGHADGLINFEPSSLLQWAIKEFGIVTLDHSLGGDLFAIIIYKN